MTMDYVTLEGDELERFREWIDGTRDARRLRVAVDPLDGAVKVKADEGVWSPPMGRMADR